MRNSLLKEQWESHVDKLIHGIWQGKEHQVSKSLSILQTALKQLGTQQNIDETLLQALDRLAAFYCLERRFDECERLFLAVERTQMEAQSLGTKIQQPIAIDKRLGILRLLREACKTNVVERDSECAKLGNGW